MGTTGQRALELLGQLAEPGARFHPGQRAAIEALVDRRRRVLVVQRTGSGSRSWPTAARCSSPCELPR